MEMLAEEQARLHRLPETAFTAAFGETRKVSWSSTISFGGVTYSVPHQLVDAEVWVRVDGDEVVATHVAATGAVEVARHLRSTPGTPRIDDAHYPPRPAGPLNRQPRATNTAEADFLALGDGARMWLLEAASAGTARVKVKMADAVMLARLHGQERVDWALGHAATYGRFADGDVASILAAHPPGSAARLTMPTRCRAAPGPGTASVIGDDRRRRRPGRRGRRTAPPASSAAHASSRPRRVGHRQGATLGTRRSLLAGSLGKRQWRRLRQGGPGVSLVAEHTFDAPAGDR